MTAEITELVALLRSLHDRLADTVRDLGPDQLRQRSYATEWTVADVLSHLGSGAELSLLRLQAGDGEGPGFEESAQVWALWDARTPEQQAVEAIQADERFVAALEALDADGIAVLHRDLMGMDLDAAQVLRLRVSEAAVHGWDIAVALDDGATLDAAALPALLHLLPVTLRWAGQPHEDHLRVRVTTTEPEGEQVLDLAPDRVRLLVPDELQDPVDGELELPAEGLVRLVYGRLDARHTPPLKVSDEALLARLREIFQGF